MTVTLDLSPEAQTRLQAEASRRGISVDELVDQLASALPAEPAVASDSLLEAFIGCGSSGRTQPFDIHRERAELADKKYAEGI